MRQCVSNLRSKFVDIGNEHEPFRKDSGIAAAIFADLERSMGETSRIGELLFFCVTGFAREVKAALVLEFIDFDCSIGSHLGDVCGDSLAWLQKSL